MFFSIATQYPNSVSMNYKGMSRDELSINEEHILSNMEFILSKEDEQKGIKLYEEKVKIHNKPTNSSKYIFTRRFSIPNPEAVVFVLHGAGTNSLLMAPLANSLKNHNIEIISYDHSHHGYTGEGKPAPEKLNDEPQPTGLIRKWQDFVTDAYNVMDYFLYHKESTSKKLHNVPVFVLGQSMGGGIAIQIPLLPIIERVHKRITGIIPLAASVDVRPARIPLVSSLVNGLSFLAPSAKPMKTPVKDLVDTRKITQLFVGKNRMKWTLPRLPFHLMNEIIKMGENAKLKMKKGELDIPMLQIHGDEDILCFLGGSHYTANHNKNQNNKLVVLEGIKHGITISVSLPETKHIILGWIQDQY